MRNLSSGGLHFWKVPVKGITSHLVTILSYVFGALIMVSATYVLWSFENPKDCPRLWFITHCSWTAAYQYMRGLSSSPRHRLLCNDGEEYLSLDSMFFARLVLLLCSLSQTGIWRMHFGFSGTTFLDFWEDSFYLWECDGMCTWRSSDLLVDSCIVACFDIGASTGFGQE